MKKQKGRKRKNTKGIFPLVKNYFFFVAFFFAAFFAAILLFHFLSF
jgi:hypothetical protein